MSAYLWAIYLYAPNSTTPIEITNRVIKSGGLNESIADPSELFATRTGDVSCVLDDQDGYFSGLFGQFNLRLDAWQFEMFRDGVRLFRGLVLPEGMQRDANARTFELTALGPRSLLQRQSASILVRQFANMSIASPGAPESATLIPISIVGGGPAVPTLGDIVRFGSDSRDYTVLSYEIAAQLLTIAEPIREALAAGTPIIVQTPYPRNTTMQALLTALFASQGITDTDIVVAGGFSALPFSTGLNEDGLAGFGALRGVQSVTSGGLRKLHCIFSRETATQQAIRQADSVDSGFVGFGPLPGLFSGALPLHGPYADSHAYGLTFAPGGTSLGDPRNPGIASAQYPIYADYFTANKTSVQVSKFTGWATNAPAGLGVMFELRLNQTIVPIPSSNAINWQSGGGAGTIRVYKYTTVNSGTTWTPDGAFGGGTGYYQIQSWGAPGLPWYEGPPVLAFMPGEDDSRDARPDGDPEQDWCISGAPLQGASGCLYVTVQLGVSGTQPQIRRLELNAPLSGISGDTTIHFNAGAHKAMRVDGSSDTWILWKNLPPASIGTDRGWRVTRDHYVGPGFTLTTEAALPISDVGLIPRSAAWNGLAGQNSRVIITFASPFGEGVGRGWVIVKPVTAAGLWNAPAIEASEVLSAPAIPPVEIVMRRPFDLQRAAFWRTEQGRDVWFIRAADRNLLVVREVTGYVAYADFDELSASEAIDQMAFLTNSRWQVEPGGIPIWKAIFRPAPDMPRRRRVIERSDGSVVDNVIIEKSLTVSHEHSYNFIRVRNARDASDPRYISKTAGSPAFEQDALELELRLLDSPLYGQSIADALAEYYAGYRVTPSSDFVTLTNTTAGASTIQYQVDVLDATGAVIAVSEVKTASGISLVSSVRVNWATTAVPGGVTARIFVVGGDLITSKWGLRAQEPWASTLYTDTPSSAAQDPNLRPSVIVLLGMRQSGTVRVVDDGYQYRTGDEITLRDLFGQVNPNDASSGLDFVIESLDIEPSGDEITLGVYQKEVFE